MLDRLSMAASRGTDMNQPERTGRSCDCPCHEGVDVFHIVACCGSILGERGRARRDAREASRKQFPVSSPHSSENGGY